MPSDTRVMPPKIQPDFLHEETPQNPAKQARCWLSEWFFTHSLWRRAQRIDALTVAVGIDQAEQEGAGDPDGARGERPHRRAGGSVDPLAHVRQPGRAAVGL